MGMAKAMAMAKTKGKATAKVMAKATAKAITFKTGAFRTACFNGKPQEASGKDFLSPSRVIPSCDVVT